MKLKSAQEECSWSGLSHTQRLACGFNPPEHASHRSSPGPTPHPRPQVVPTVYRPLDKPGGPNRTVATNQFSVTENFRESQGGMGRSLPGLFFFYDLSPIKVGDCSDASEACPAV